MQTIFLLLVLFGAPIAQACDYYASPSGRGNGISPDSSFQIADFWPVAGAGKSLCLMNGVYTDERSNIYPPKGMSGRSTAPITVMAIENGQARIDGQNSRVPVLLTGNAYFVIQGINANNSSGSVIDLAAGSHDNIIRKVVAWDARDENHEIFGIHDSHHNLLEDVAGFGVARKIFSFSQNGNNNICRRCWGRWEGSTNVGPKDTFELVYNNHDNIYENVIGTWNNGSMPKSYILQNNKERWTGAYAGSYNSGDTDQAYGVIAEGQPNSNARTRVFGSIAYVRATDKFSAQGLYFVQAGQSGLEFFDDVAYFDAGSHTHTPTFNLRSEGAESGLIAKNLTAIGGAGNKIGGKWVRSNVIYSRTTARSPNIFNSPRGARICNRYETGRLTTQPLWPWPMNRRILDATTFAAAPNHQHYIYQGNPPELTLVTQPHERVDVTATIESMFGPIPSACK